MMSDTEKSDKLKAPEAAGAPNAESEQTAATHGAPPASSETPPAQKDERPSLFRREESAGPANDAAALDKARRARQRRRKRRGGTLSAMSGLMTFFLVAVVAAIFGLISSRHVLNEPGPLRADKVVYMPPRSDTPEILAQLEREGVIDNSLLVNLTLLIEGKRGALKPGEYLFKQAASLREVIDVLVNGRQLLHAVTIPEGLTSEQVTQRLRENDILAGDILDMPKEGALLPETYKVARGYPRSKLLAKMQEDQRKLVEQIWARRNPDLPFRTPFELVTLASVVEKETGKAEERPMVAAVFVNRLRKGMRLQSDPTIVYGLVGGKATLGRGILRSELEKFTAYNTYLVDGLPPGPISNPGRAALEATANPAPTSDLYFVADGTGGHVFAQTLDEHNRNVQRWRQIEHDSKEKAAAPDVDHVAPSATQPTPPPAPTAAPAPAPTPKGQRGDAGSLGRFVALTEGREDYPRARATSPDEGAAHRLGKFGSRAGLLAVEALDDPTGGSRLSGLRPARAFVALAATNSSIALGYDEPGASAEGSDEAEGLSKVSENAGALAYSGDAGSYPVSPRQRAELKARAARLGLPPSSDQLPAEILSGRAEIADAASETRSKAPHRKALDASEGTPLDPLLDKTWDLSTAKTVPLNVNLR
jgi:UPF0755 protein